MTIISEPPDRALAPSPNQRAAAMLAGAAYLIALPLAFVAEAAAPSHLSLVAGIVVAVVDAALITGLFLTLAPVTRILATFALVTRTIETTLLISVVLVDAALLRVTQAGGDVRLFESVHRDAYTLSLVLAGIGSAMFCIAWRRSSYVPAWLPLLGLIASMILAARELIFFGSPELARRITLLYFGGPIFAFELTMGAWLLARGLRRIN